MAAFAAGSRPSPDKAIAGSPGRTRIPPNTMIEASHSATSDSMPRRRRYRVIDRPSHCGRYGLSAAPKVRRLQPGHPVNEHLEPVQVRDVRSEKVLDLEGDHIPAGPDLLDDLLVKGLARCH